MPGNGAVVGLGWALADQDLGSHELLAAALRPGPGDAQRAPGAQAGRQLAAQRAAAVDIERLVDRLVRDAHRFIIGKVERQPVGNLVRTPRPRPATVLPTAVPPTDPACVRPRHCRAVRGRERAREPVVHVLPQRVIGGELGRLRATCATVGVPLGGAGAVVQAAASGGGIATQFPGDRRWTTSEPARDRADTDVLRAQDRNLLALGERQVPARMRLQADRPHSAGRQGHEALRE